MLDPPRAGAPGELRTRWIDARAPRRRPHAPGVARSVHAALAHFAQSRPVPRAPVRLVASHRTRSCRGAATRDPYAVLVCEVMSQQTQIERVRVYWERWIARWPTAAALAAAPLAEVLRAWQGLGYPRRARDLHAAARRIASDGWPDPERLSDLPGVGRYTADGDPLLRLRAAGAAARRQRPSRAGATVPRRPRGDSRFVGGCPAR